MPTFGWPEAAGVSVDWVMAGVYLLSSPGSSGDAFDLRGQAAGRGVSYRKTTILEDCHDNIENDGCVICRSIAGVGSLFTGRRDDGAN